MSNFPIQLWYHIVNPTLVNPQLRIGKQIVVVGETVGFAAPFVLFLVAIDAKRADAKANPWFGGFYGVANGFNQYVYVISTPLGKLIGFVKTVGFGKSFVGGYILKF